MACTRCGNDNCFGYVLLHPKECGVVNIARIKANAKVDHGQDIKFNMIDSPSSGEVFTKFKELHMISNNLERK